MSDLETAKNNLDGHTLTLCKGGRLITSDKRGVTPMAELLQKGFSLSGFAAADKVVGKAAAMLFIKAKIREIYAEVISKGAINLLKSHNIAVTFDVLTDRILNRNKTGICPMETLVSNTDDIEEGYNLIIKKLDELNSLKQ